MTAAANRPDPAAATSGRMASDAKAEAASPLEADSVHFVAHNPLLRAGTEKKPSDGKRKEGQPQLLQQRASGTGTSGYRGNRFKRRRCRVKSGKLEVELILGGSGNS